MRIVAVLGSPRLNGNSAFLADRLLEATKNRGAQTRSFTLDTLTYQGCQACRACKKSSNICVLKDDVTDVLSAMQEADVIVLASPVYWGDVSGQMKLFVDRTYCFLSADFSPRLCPGKTGVFIQTQGLDDTMYNDVFPRYALAMRTIGIEAVHHVRGCGLFKLDDARKQEDLLKQVDDLAEQIMERSNTRDKTFAMKGERNEHE